MNTGNVKRSIKVEQPLEDVFSDEIKTAALIEEIEAAEKEAKKAKLEKQIENSQPDAWQKVADKLTEKATAAKKLAKEKLAELKMKSPKDPRVKKTGIKDALRVMKSWGQKVAGAAQRFNSLVPEGVSRKTLIEFCVAGALIVTGVEVWAWNLSHPLFSSTEPESVTVPVTGDATEEEDDSPMEQQDNTEQEAETANAQSDADEAVNTERTAPSYSGYSTSTRSGTTTQRTTTTTRSQSSGVNVDSQWNDSAENMWPVIDEGDEVEDTTPDDAENNGEQPAEEATRQ